MWRSPFNVLHFRRLLLMNFSEQVKFTLWELIDEMSTDLSDYVKNPGKDFTRKKKWDFSTVIKFIISMESQSLKYELLKYFGYTTDCPSNASFNQRRSQICVNAFESLFHKFTLQYSKHLTLFKGYRLIACDGSDVNISYDSSDTESYLSNGQPKGYNQMHLNAMYDLLNRIYTDIIIQPGRIDNEHHAFCDMVDRYNSLHKTIFITDRGYEAYNNIAHVMEKGQFFLIRCKDIYSTGMLSGLKHKLPEKEIFDTLISFRLTRKYTKEVISHPEIYKRFHKKDCFDYFDLEENPYYEMNLRVLRFPISEDTYECIITNLSDTEFTMDDIKMLYNMRWGIETSFRELKYAVGLSGFHSKKREYIIQEIWAKLILYNFCEIITTHVTIEKCTRKHIYQVNYTYAIQVCKYFISKMAEESPPDVEALISKEVLPVRPGRHDPRKVDRKKPISFLYRIA